VLKGQARRFFTMAVRIDNRGPFAVYRFERGSTHRVTLELPAVMLPPPLPPKQSLSEPPPLPVRSAQQSAP
jgi:hypothetical protein